MASRGSKAGAAAATAKHALREPSAVAVVRALRHSPLRAGLALCYHRIGDPQGRAGYELVPALGTRLFAAQVSHLASQLRLVRASELPEAAATRPRRGRLPLAAALRDGRDELEAICGAPLQSVAYPFGAASPAVADAARAAGLKTGWTLAPVHVVSGDDPLLLGRSQPSFASAGHTAMELARALARRAAA